MTDKPKTIFATLPDSQVFSRDPEKWEKESIADATARIRAIVTKHRRARGLSMESLAEEIKSKAAKKRVAKAPKAAASKTKRGKASEADGPPEGPGILDSPLSE